MALGSTPNVSCIPVTIEVNVTAEIVSPILASAGPSAKLRLVCSLFSRAALKAAMPSGRRTTAAMRMPTGDLGAPIYKTDFSIAGASVLANKNTTPGHSTIIQH